MRRILLVGGDEAMVSSLEQQLRECGYSVTATGVGAPALGLARDGSFDLLVLDLDLAEVRGQDLLRSMRSRGETMPVIVLGRPGGADVVAVLEGGANDFVTKPFNLEELLARVSVRLRPPRPGAPTNLTAGAMKLDLLSRRCSVGGRVVDLTAREFDVAEVFFRHPGQVLTREQLAARVWGGPEAASNIIDVYVRYLRRKLGPDIIGTVRGIGYRLTT